MFITFARSPESSEDRLVTAMGVLSTLESILSVMDDNAIIMQNLEGIILRIVEVIFTDENLGVPFDCKYSLTYSFTSTDFYEEVLSLVDSLTTSRVSGNMWQLWPVLYEHFKKDGVDFFMDYMPVLYNYLKVDTDAFMSVPTRAEQMIDVAAHVCSLFYRHTRL